MYLFSIQTNLDRQDKEDSYTKLYEEDNDYTYNEVIHEIGFGWYQYKMLATVAVMNTSLGVFMAMIGFLIPLYKHDVHITETEIGFLVASQGLGSLLGGLLFGYVSDLKGRKFSLLLALLWTIASSIVCTLFSTFWPFVSVRFISSIGYGGLMPVGITYLTEYLPDDRRGFYLIGMDIFRNLGGLLSILIASYSGDSWRFFVLSPVPLFVLTMIIMMIYLPESNRYLIYTKNIEEVIKNFDRMCIENKKAIKIRSSEVDPMFSKSRNNGKETSIWNDLFVKKARITIPLALVWFFPAFGTGIFVFLPEIMIMQGFSMNEIYIISGFLLFLPMFGVIASSIFIDRFGRKQLIALCSLVSALSLGSFLIIPEDGSKIITYYVILGVFSIFMKMLKSITSAYTPELYSTSTRTTAVGVMSGIDRFASILQPFIFTTIIYTSTQMAMVAFGGWYFLGFIFSLWLGRETANKPLKDSFLSDITESNMGNSQIGISILHESVGHLK